MVKVVRLKERSAEMDPPAVVGFGLFSGVNGFNCGGGWSMAGCVGVIQLPQAPGEANPGPTFR